MLFWEEIRRMKKMLISIHPYILEGGKKKRLAGGVIRPPAGASRCVKVTITEAIKLWRSDFRNDQRRSRRNWHGSDDSFELAFNPSS
jgi:hypothetical protein